MVVGLGAYRHGMHMGWLFLLETLEAAIQEQGVMLVLLFKTPFLSKRHNQVSATIVPPYTVAREGERVQRCVDACKGDIIWLKKQNRLIRQIPKTLEVAIALVHS